MPEPRKSPPINLGIFSRSGGHGMSTAEVVAIALSTLWVLLVGGFFLFAADSESAGSEALNLVMIMLAVFLPVAVIWIGAVAARSARIMRAESARLQAAVDAMRHAYVTQAQAGGIGVRPSFEKKLDEIAAAQKQTETAIVTFATSRDQGAQHVPPPQAPARTDAEGQAALALGTPAEELAHPISGEDFVRALNFPETENDTEGFNALRRALKDRQTAKLVRAAQDVLTLLSQDGIYTDDLRPDRARPEIWRKFAAGERGRSIAALGGVRDRSSLALSAGRMKQDQIFRDSVHHFLREFDKSFSAFADRASDQEIAEFSDTRTARAFMLLGRVTGTFD